MFSASSVQSGYKEVFGSIESSRVGFPDADLPEHELGNRGIELTRVFGIGSCRKMARKELGVKIRLHT
jgi:hypothetical protein